MQLTNEQYLNIQARLANLESRAGHLEEAVGELEADRDGESEDTDVSFPAFVSEHPGTLFAGDVPVVDFVTKVSGTAAVSIAPSLASNKKQSPVGAR